MTTELTLPERAAVALGTAKHEKELLELVEQSKSITEIKNKDARDDATKFSKAVIAEEDRLVALIEPDETRLIALRDVWDAEREAERQAKLEAEQKRVGDIRSRIADMAAIPTMMVGKSSEAIAIAIESLEATEITLDTHQEFAGEGEMAKIATLDKLREMWVAQAAVELAAAEAARQAELDRIERERVAEANRLEAKRLADLAAAMEVEAQLARDRQALADKQAREKREAVEAEQRAANERAAAAMRAEQQAHEQRMASERAELQRQQDEITRAREAVEAEARAKREAEEAAARAEAQRVADEQAAEARRIQAEKDARQAEHERRVRVEFERVGPGEKKILDVLAEQFEVNREVALNWIVTFDVERINHMEKAA